MFKSAGWHEGRNKALPDGLYRDRGKGHPAEEILTSLAGLHVGKAGAGLECARSDLQFAWLADDYSDAIGPWERLLSTELVGVAEVHHGHEALLVLPRFDAASVKPGMIPLRFIT